MDLESFLKGLNAEQRAAVLHSHEENEQLLILAGAGSGKTSVLTKRIQYRIFSGVKPEKILALTFTAKAAGEMRERVEALFPKAGVRLCTFHSLALFMLKEKIGNVYAYEILGFKKCPMPTETANQDFLRELSKCNIGKAKFSRELLFSEELPKSLKKKILPLKKMVLETGQVVFEDLIYSAITLLETSNEARDYFQNSWDEILVDEYQDINPTQYKLVRLILGNKKALFVVGDDDQAIYGFRGADIGNIQRFCEDFKKSTIIRLEWNYRSVPNILHLANQIFTKKPLALQKVLRAGNKNGSGGNPLFKENRKPEVWVSENPVEEMVRVIARIKELRESYDLSWKNFAILVRYNRQRLYYEEFLKDVELPVFSDEVEDGIHVETVHASKGLQYAVVFYAGLAEGLTPGECKGSRKVQKKQLDEERRLYYVGVTRAEAYLVLLYCKERFWKGRLVQFKPSRFLPKTSALKKSKNMPLLLFKIRVVVLVLGYMAMQMCRLPYKMIFRRKTVDLWINKRIQTFSHFCMRVLHIDLSVEDQANLAKVDWTKPVFVMGNHNSFADIPVVFISLERTIGFLAKKELGLIPFLNFWMKKIGCLLLDRKKGGGGPMIRESMKRTGKAPWIFIFPEGTRSKNGSLNAFKSGGFRLALEAEATILPVVIKGTAESWERRKNSAWVSVKSKILEPVNIAELLKTKEKIDPKKDLMNPIYKSMEDALKGIIL